MQLIDAFNTARYTIDILAEQPGATPVMIRLSLALDVIYDLFLDLNRQIGLGGPDWLSLATDRLGGLKGRGVDMLDEAHVTLRVIIRERRADMIEGLLKELDAPPVSRGTT
jgi:hypothetical protein